MAGRRRRRPGATAAAACGGGGAAVGGGVGAAAVGGGDGTAGAACRLRAAADDRERRRLQPRGRAAGCPGCRRVSRQCPAVPCRLLPPGGVFVWRFLRKYGDERREEWQMARLEIK